MKMHVFNNPTVLDFIRVVLTMLPDQRDHFTTMTGHPYDVDGIAVGNFMVPGPKWAFKTEDGEPICVGGFAPQRPGVYRDYFISGPKSFSPDYYFPVTRTCRRLIEMMLRTEAHRVECIVPAPRVTPVLDKWYATLGYNKEALRHGYCANGADAICYARVRH